MVYSFFCDFFTILFPFFLQNELMCHCFKVLFVLKNYRSLIQRAKKKLRFVIQNFTLNSNNNTNLYHVSIYLLPICTSQIWMHFYSLKTCFLHFQYYYYLMQFSLLQQFYRGSLHVFQSRLHTVRVVSISSLGTTRPWLSPVDVDVVFYAHSFAILSTFVVGNIYYL